MRPTLCMVAVLAGSYCLAASASSASAEDLAQPRDDWDRLFQRADGWTGGDADYSLALPGDRVLWLFADSWIGPVAEGKHAPGSRLVNNALAIHPTPRVGTAPDSIEFFWGPPDGDGHPTAWFTPDRARVTPRPPRGGDASAPTWYWVADGVVLPSAAPKLLVFLWHIGRTKGEGVWNFASVGGTLAAIENVAGPPSEWRVTQFDNPHVVPDAGREQTPQRKPVTWGSEVLLQPAEQAEDPPWLMIYGTRDAGRFNTELVLARVPSDRAVDFAAWEFYAGDAWTRDLLRAKAVASGLVSEFSISPVTISDRPRWVLIQSEPLFGTRILARLADQPTGPWSAPRPIYQVPDVDSKQQHFTYAAKAHPELSAPGKLLVTYIINSHDFWKMAADANIYRPRFVELDLQQFAAAP